MTSREEKKLLVDIIDSINSIDEHLEGKRILEEYLTNKTKRRAVEREIEIIGEAMSKLLKLNPNTPTFLCKNNCRFEKQRLFMLMTVSMIL